MSIQSPLEQRLARKLDQRVRESSLRTLDLPNRPKNTRGTVDFSSNDYLGLAHSTSQHKLVESKYKQHTLKYPPPFLGSTGSRLLSGNSSLALQLENYLSTVHNRPAALLCNSGYDANLSILSSIPMPHDYIILDELAHNSLIMGMKMSRIRMDHVFYFRHNDVADLKRILTQVKEEAKSQGHPIGNVTEEETCCFMVVVESVYSMDGDVAPLKKILELSATFGANVVVDEAHGLGVYGRTNIHDLSLQIFSPSVKEQPLTRNEQGGEMVESEIEDDALTKQSLGVESHTHEKYKIGGTGVLAALELENHPALLTAVFTFGKAAGCHGSVIVGSKTLVRYLVNYARPFVYSTSLPSHSLWTIKCAYDTMIGVEGERLRDTVFRLVRIFRSHLEASFVQDKNTSSGENFHQLLLPSPSPIQSVICKGNEHCVRVAKKLRALGGFSVFPIRSPTVPKGEERIRIILHAHNTDEEVLHLVDCLVKFINPLHSTNLSTIPILNRNNLLSKL